MAKDNEQLKEQLEIYFNIITAKDEFTKQNLIEEFQQEWDRTLHLPKILEEMRKENQLLTESAFPKLTQDQVKGKFFMRLIKK